MTTMNTTIQVRIDEKTKKAAEKVLRQIGMDISSGVKVFLNQVVNTKSMPFRPRTANGFSAEKERKMIEELADIKKNGKLYKSVDELLMDVLER